MILSRDTTVGLVDQRTSADFEEMKVKSMMNSSETFIPGNRRERAKICDVCGKESSY